MPKKRKRISKRQPAGPQKVVLTGGPAAGKTAICDILLRHLKDQVAVVPESASILFKGGFPRPSSVAGRRLVQKAIFSTQRQLEEIYSLTHPQVSHILDRGSLDGAAYWPGGADRFLGAMGTTMESECRRYNAVIFLESSAYEESSYSTENPYRTETPAQARRVDATLREVWENHPHFVLIGRETKFYEKVAAVLFALNDLLRLEGKARTRRPRGSSS